MVKQNIRWNEMCLSNVISLFENPENKATPTPLKLVKNKENVEQMSNEINDLNYD